MENVPSTGVKGEKGDKGDKGEAGTAATVEIGSVTTGAAGTQAKVVNVGTATAARLNFTIPRGDKGERGDSGDSGSGGVTDHEQLSNLLGGSANNHYHLTLEERNKLQNMSSNGNMKYRLVRETFLGGITPATENKQNGYSDINSLEGITVPEGVDRIFISGCGGGGGLEYNNVIDGFVSGWSGASCLKVEFGVLAGDVIRVYPGRGGFGINISSDSTFQTTKGTSSCGEDSVVFLNGNEMVRLPGGASGSVAHAGARKGATFKEYRDVEISYKQHLEYGSSYFNSNFVENYMPGISDLDIQTSDKWWKYIKRIFYGFTQKVGFFNTYGAGGDLSWSNGYKGINGGNGEPGLIIIEYIVPVGS